MDAAGEAAQPAVLDGQVCFFTLVGSERQEQHARLLIKSLRAFGGWLGPCPVWVFLSEPGAGPNPYADMENVHCVPLAIEATFRSYFFAAKVFACAQAEEMAARGVRSLVWLNPQSLIVNPPLLFDLAPRFDVALRVVHHRNVGSLAGEPLDDFWRAIYAAVGLEEAPFTVESFADLCEIRPYFNTHCFSIHPARGICRAWLECFRTMVTDRAFQSGPCRDTLRQIFMHQAILSALIAQRLDRKQIRLLPPEYSYPLHMHRQVPEARRAQDLNSLVCAVYEETTPLEEIEVREPLRSWLAERMSPGSGST